MKPYATLCRLGLWPSVIMLVTLISSCGATSPASEAQTRPGPSPTVAPVFQPLPFVPTVAPAASPVLPSAPVRLSADQVELLEVTIYDDGLDANWTVNNSEGMVYDLESYTYTKSGNLAAEVAPLYPASEFLFTVRPEAIQQYPRDKVIGVSFWLSGGSEYIDTDDLVVAILGSNDFPYWIENDYSVARSIGEQPGDPIFSDTRLYFLGLNRPIPPDTWAEVTNWLDDRVFDPPYEFVTGFYIKNDVEFAGSFYVDRVVLSMLP